jgi:hypothetical protein
MIVLVVATYAHVQRLISVIKMVTVLEYTTEEQRSVLRFCGQKDSMRRIFIKKCFLFMVGSVCRLKRFTTGSRNSLKNVREVADDAQPGLEVAKTTVKNFYAVGFDALVKRWDKCINVGRGYVEK